MSAPFIALTIPKTSGGIDRPVFVNALHIRTVNERWERKAGHDGPFGPDNFELVGSWICVGSGEEGAFPVTESYGEVTGAIRDAMA